MEDMAEYTAEFSSDHSTLLIKRSKRSKRPRPSSPFCPAADVTAAMTSSSYSSGGDGGGGGGGAGSGSTSYYPIEEQNNSPSTSTDLSDATAEEAELVDCLLMLARGICPMKKLKKDGQQQSTDEKFNSGRRSTESVTSTAPSSAEKGHQCVTCNRIFPSFQALGGHRASHRKPKLSPPGENSERSLVPLTNYLPPLVNSDEDEEEDEAQLQLQARTMDRKFALAPVPLQMIAGNGKAAKLHGCSICGMEFASGQALGGHMRKHRPILPATSPPPPPTYSYPQNSQIVANIDTTEDVVVAVVDNRSDNILPFDLNLPAPDDDHQNLASTSTRITIPASAWLNCN